MKDLIENELTLDADSVWVRPDAKVFGYSDGVQSERYLEQVLRGSSDLSMDSVELELQARDWPSEYHLTRARAQLLKPFGYDRSKTVLEVGCGCGAITRFLGQTFDRVVSVEGSHARARLARLRTRDLDGVSIVNSPFEELRFNTRFDLIFCIGVFEYSSVFVKGDEPHERILDYFAELLEPDGVLVLAIENQLGLKYFGASAEDHTGVMFDGIEGYPRITSGARTFGYTELTRRLNKRFREVEFYFPWPDYKVPSCVISQRMIDSVNVSELVGSFRSVDYGQRGRMHAFSEPLAWHEIAENRMIPWLAHSFLVFAGKQDLSQITADWLGVLYSNRRRPEFSTLTRFLMDPDGSIRVVKRRTDGQETYSEGELLHRGWEGRWIEGLSLQMTMARRARARSLGLEQILEPSRPWFDDLKASSTVDGGSWWVDGSRLDSIWRNCYVVDGGCTFIDQEWAWRERLPLKLVVARGLYYFATSLLGSSGLSPALQGMNVSRFIARSAASYGLKLDRADFAELVRFEADLLDRTSVRSGNASRRQALGRLDVRLVLRRELDPVRRERVRVLAGKVLRRLKRLLRPSRV